MASLRASRRLAAVVLATVLLTACGSDTSPDSSATATGDASLDETSPDVNLPTDAEDDVQRFPDVVDAELEPDGDTWRLSVTLSSPYDTPERYADAFRARSEDGTELGVRELAHDHANEQPFTRSLAGLAIPDDVSRIMVEGRDQEYGWGGETVEVLVPAPSDGDGNG